MKKLPPSILNRVTITIDRDIRWKLKKLAEDKGESQQKVVTELIIKAWASRG